MNYELTDDERTLIVNALQKESDRLHRNARGAAGTYAAPPELGLRLRREADAHSDLAKKLKYS